MRPSRQIGLAYAYRSGPPCTRHKPSLWRNAGRHSGCGPTGLAADGIGEADLRSNRVRAPDDPREFQPLL